MSIFGGCGRTGSFSALIKEQCFFVLTLRSLFGSDRLFRSPACTNSQKTVKIPVNLNGLFVHSVFVQLMGCTNTSALCAQCAGCAGCARDATNLIRTTRASLIAQKKHCSHERQKTNRCCRRNHSTRYLTQNGGCHRGRFILSGSHESREVVEGTVSKKLRVRT